MGKLTIFFNAPEDIVNIIGEEATGVQHGLDKTRNGTNRHVLGMGMSIPLQANEGILDENDLFVIIRRWAMYTPPNAVVLSSQTCYRLLRNHLQPRPPYPS